MSIELKTLHLEDASTLEHIQKPPMLIDELIPDESITLIAGPTFCGKTFIALEAAKAVAFGHPFMGRWPVPNPGNVLFLEADSPKYDTGRALYAMLKPIIKFLKAETDSTRHPLKSLQIDWESRLNLESHEDAALIARTANSLYTPLGYFGEEEAFHKGTRLIILDTFRRHHTADEDKSTQMQVIMNRLDYIRERTDAAIMILHHTSKSSKDNPRGSNVIEGSVDNIYLVRKDGRSKHLHKMVPNKTRSIAPPGFWWQIITEPDPLAPDGVIKRVEWIKDIENPNEVNEDSGPDKEAIPPALKPSHTDLLAHMHLCPEGQTTIDLNLWGQVNFNVKKALVAKWRKRLVTDGLLVKKGSHYVLT